MQYYCVISGNHDIVALIKAETTPLASRLQDLYGYGDSDHSIVQVVKKVYDQACGVGVFGYVNRTALGSLKARVKCPAPSIVVPRLVPALKVKQSPEQRRYLWLLKTVIGAERARHKIGHKTIAI